MSSFYSTDILGSMPSESLLSERVSPLAEIFAAIPLLLAIIHDLVPRQWRIKLPHLLRIGDLGIPLSQNGLPRWKFLSFAILNATGLCVALFEAAQQKPSALTILSCLCWLYALLLTIFKPPICPPYRLLWFYRAFPAVSMP